MADIDATIKRLRELLAAAFVDDPIPLLRDCEQISIALPCGEDVLYASAFYPEFATLACEAINALSALLAELERNRELIAIWESEIDRIDALFPGIPAGVSRLKAALDELDRLRKIEAVAKAICQHPTAGNLTALRATLEANDGRTGSVENGSRYGE